MNISPGFLKKGDTIGIAAPARSVSEEIITGAENVFRSWGLEIYRGKNLSGKFNQCSGTEQQRLDSLQEIIDNKDIKAIICAGGGYGSIHLIDKLKVENLKKYPKWLTGFSDITLLHFLFLGKGEVQTLHATMPVKFKKNTESKKSIASLYNALFGKQLIYRIGSSPYNRIGRSKGIVIGGNLSILYSLLGTPYDIDFTGKILFIEEVDEYLYHIERMMYSLKLAGKFNNLKGLIVGNISKVHDNDIPFGKNEYEIICDIIKEYDFPVIFGFPAGHEKLNLALYLGKEAEINVQHNEAIIGY